MKCRIHLARCVKYIAGIYLTKAREFVTEVKSAREVKEGLMHGGLLDEKKTEGQNFMTLSL
jgi:hypothetical protein